MRDYGRGDLAEQRLASKEDKSKLSQNFYVRADGTRAYYFSTEEVRMLFVEAGFVELENTYIERTVENRKKGLSMDRTWLQCKFLKPSPPSVQETEPRG